MPHTRSYYLPALLIIVLTISFFRLGSLKLFDVDEAVFAQATKEMVESGDWLTPTYNGANRYDKPILFYWLMALSYKTFGINEWGARFPSAAAGALLCLCLFLFLRRETDEHRAFYAVISLVLSLYFVIYSHAAVTDMMLTLFITLSLFSFYRFCRSDGPEHGYEDGYEQHAAGQSRYYLYGFYIFSALAFLTKGLIGIVFPFGIAGMYLLITGGITRTTRIFSTKGFVLFLVVAAPWYLAELSANGWEFIDQFFIKHHFKRYTEVISGHKGPWYYYLLTLTIGLMPWITYIPAGIAGAWKQFRMIQRGKGPGNEVPKLYADRSPELFALIWFSAVVVFFSLSTTKLPNYILPSVPAAAILIAFGMAGRSEKQVRYSKILIAAVSILLGVATVAGPALGEQYLVRLGIADFEWTQWAALIFFAGAALNLAGAFKKKNYHEYGAFLMLLLLLLLSFKALPLANRHLQDTLYIFSQQAKERLGKDGSLVVYRINKPSIVFYSGHKVISADQPEDVEQIMNVDKKVLIITTASDANDLEKKGLTLIEKDKAYALFEKK